MVAFTRRLRRHQPMTAIRLPISAVGCPVWVDQRRSGPQIHRSTADIQACRPDSRLPRRALLVKGCGIPARRAPLSDEQPRPEGRHRTSLEGGNHGERHGWCSRRRRYGDSVIGVAITAGKQAVSLCHHVWTAASASPMRRTLPSLAGQHEAARAAMREPTRPTGAWGSSASRARHVVQRWS